MNSEGYQYQYAPSGYGGGEGHQTVAPPNEQVVGGGGGYGSGYGQPIAASPMESGSYLGQQQQQQQQPGGQEQQYYQQQGGYAASSQGGGGGVSYPTLPQQSEHQRSAAPAAGGAYYNNQSQSQQHMSDELVNITYSDQQYQPPRGGNYNNHGSHQSPRQPAAKESGGGGGGGSSPRYSVTFKGEFGETQSVYCEIGMDGLKLTDCHNNACLETFPLNIISRWAVREKETFLFWVAKDGKTSGGKQRQVELKGSMRDVNNMLDTITAACMQLCEVIDKEDHQNETNDQDEDGADYGQCSSSSGGAQEKKGLVGWIAGKVKPGDGGSTGNADGNSVEDAMTSIPEGVEYWKNPDYDGWMQSQGDHIKTWRKRWFVLKDGYLFRFLNDKVLPQTKPRGILNLALCLEISKATKDAKPGATIQVGVQKKKGLSAGLGASKEAGVENILFVADSKAERDLWLEIMNRARKDVVQSKEKKKEEKKRTVAETSRGVVVEPENVDERLLKALEGYKKSAKPSPQVTTSAVHMPSAPCEPKPATQHHQLQQQARPSPPTSDGGQTNWKVCYTPDGRAYYYNTVTGITQWEAPVF